MFFSARDKEVTLTLYKSLVRPRVEYSCPLWDPKQTGNIILFRTGAKAIHLQSGRSKHLSYWERLSALKLMSLQRLRERICSTASLSTSGMKKHLSYLSQNSPLICAQRCSPFPPPHAAPDIQWLRFYPDHPPIYPAYAGWVENIR